MKKEIEIAIKRGHYLFVKNLDGDTITGLPVQSDDPAKLKMNTLQGSMWIPLDEVGYLSRVIKLR